MKEKIIHYRVCFFCRWTAQIKQPMYFPFSLTFVVLTYKNNKNFCKEITTEFHLYFYWKLTLLSKQHGLFVLMTTSKHNKKAIGRISDVWNHSTSIEFAFIYAIKFAIFVNFVSTNVTLNRKCIYWQFDLGGSPAEWHTLLTTTTCLHFYLFVWNFFTWIFTEHKCESIWPQNWWNFRIKAQKASCS